MTKIWYEWHDWPNHNDSHGRTPNTAPVSRRDKAHLLPPQPPKLLWYTKNKLSFIVLLMCSTKHLPNNIKRYPEILNNFKNNNKFSCVPSCCQLLLWYHLYYLHCCVVGTICLAADPGALRAPQRPLQHNFDYCKLYNWWRPVFTEEITVANHLHHPGTKKVRTDRAPGLRLQLSCSGHTRSCCTILWKMPCKLMLSTCWCLSGDHQLSTSTALPVLKVLKKLSLKR